MYDIERLLQIYFRHIRPSDPLPCAVGGSEVLNDYFSRLGDIGQNIKIRSARYDEKHDVLTAYASDKGFVEYRNTLRHWQHNKGRYNKYGHKK